jgi:hypothetical protein
LRLGQRLAFARHEIIVRLRQSEAAHHLALAGVIHHEGRSGLATLERRFARIEAHLALLLFRAVALDAVLLEDGLNVFGEIHLGFSGGQDARAQGGAGHNHDQLFHSVLLFCLNCRESVKTDEKPRPPIHAQSGLMEAEHKEAGAFIKEFLVRKTE